MTEYGRGLQWYLSSESVYAAEGNKLQFFPIVNSFIEIWNYTSGHTEVIRGDLEPSDVSGWVAQDPPEDSNQNKPSGGLRLILTILDHPPPSEWRDTFAFSKQTLIEIMTKFHLPVSYLQGDYLRYGCYSRHSLSELTGGPSNTYRGFILGPPVNFADDHTFIFTWNADTNVTQGLLRVGSKSTLDILLKCILSVKTLANHAVSLGIASLENNVAYSYHGIGQINNSLYDIQIETGHTGTFYASANSRDLPPPLGYNGLTVSLSIIGQKISLFKKYSMSATRGCDFLLESIDHLEQLKGSTLSSSSSSLLSLSFQRDTQILRDLVRAILNKAHHQSDALDHYQEMCRIQNQAVYNLIAQRDVQQNIELAKDSKSIAVASKRDSSAMTSIAILTMLVLPGTFVSSLFAVPLFDWDAGSWGEIAKPRFWFYWAITLPLTFLVLAAWFTFQKIWHRRGVELDRKARDSAESVPFTTGGSGESKWSRRNWKFPARRRHIAAV